MRLVVVALALVLAFSVNAQQTYSLDPEMVNISEKSESVSVLRTQPIGFTPIGRRAVAPQVEPNVWTPWEAAVVVRSSGKVGTDDVFAATYHVFTPLPYGSMIECWVRKPGGEIYPPSVLRVDITVPDVAGWQWWIWNEPLPADWPVGVTTFEVVVTIDGKKYTAVARVATGGVYPAGDPSFGPLEKAIVDSVGGVLLRGIFQTSPIVVAPTYLNRKVELEGGNYVPPKAIGSGTKPLGVCSGMNGDPFFLECTTKVVTIPAF